MNGDKREQMEQVAKADGTLYFGEEAHEQILQDFFFPHSSKFNADICFNNFYLI